MDKKIQQSKTNQPEKKFGQPNQKPNTTTNKNPQHKPGQK